MTPEQMLREFHASKAIHGGLMPGRPTAEVPPDVRDLRIALLDEEVEELREAMVKGDIVAIADGIADVVFVAVGTAVPYGIPFDAVLREVFRSNMTKVNDIPKAKLTKGPGYEPPDIAAALGQRDGKPVQPMPRDDKNLTASHLPDAADAYLAGVRAREQAATPGPWTLETDISDDETADDHPWPYAIVMPEPNHMPADRSLQDFDFKYTELAEMTMPTAEFLVAARSDVPRLLGALEAVMELVRSGANENYDLDGNTEGTVLRVIRRDEIRDAITKALTGEDGTDAS
jgi:predicted HAD superfamily Cof-like phosphohydrolase